LLWDEKFGDHIQVGGEIFHTHLDQPWGPTSILHKWYRVCTTDTTTRV